MPLRAQDANAPPTNAQNAPAAAETAAPHQPPDESLFAPISAIADALGISALLSGLGLQDPVASALGGIVIIGILIALIFLVWWKLMGRYRITGRRKNEVRRR